MSWGVDGVTVRFGDRVALADVSLQVLPGRVTCVVGGDGAGKTTLLRCLAGAIAHDEGTVHRPDARRIGYLASSSGTYPDLTVEENLGFAAGSYGVPPRHARERAAELLERTGLGTARDRLAGNLSGGMRQKLGVIGAMLHRPDLLILDEPTTGIDPVSRADLWWLIARAAAQGAAVLLATAYLDEAERASWLLALDEGRALAEGSPERISASVPGTILAVSERPRGEASRRAWRRGSRWRVWVPDAGTAGSVPPGSAVRPDLHDAVTVAALVRELAAWAGDAA
ncbi:MAG TPA: ABC transporter ATP-binding protein [Actinomycetota bacterium]